MRKFNVSVFEKEITRIQKGELSAEEIEAARTRLKVGNRFSLQSPATRATKVTLNALYGKDPMAWLDYEDRLNGISPIHRAKPPGWQMT